MRDKYKQQLMEERDMLKNMNPFREKPLDIPQPQRRPTKNNSKKFRRPQIQEEEFRSIPYSHQKEKSGNYFHLILGSDFEDLEMEIRGLRYYKEINEDGREVIVTKRMRNHYLSEEGAEDLLLELKGHLSSDIKLGVLNRDEFLMTQDIIRKFLVSYIQNNLYKLGMDTEEKQRKAATLIVMMLSRIRAVYSRSIGGEENKRSHGDIKLSGELDFQKEERFRMEDIKN